MNKDLVAIFEYLEREKGIKRGIIVKAIEESLQIAARKSIEGAGTINVSIDPKTGEIDVTAEKEVVEKVEYPNEEVSLEEIEELGISAEIGDWIEVSVTPADFGRIAAQTAKQVISQRIRGAERDVIYEEYRHRINEIISGTVKKIARGGTLIVDLGKVDAILPDRFFPRTEKYHVGDRITALLCEVKDTENGGAEVVLSRSSPEFVKQLFIQEVPELSDETIAIEKIVRDAGYRTKLAVVSYDNKVDPLGACVGVRGTRVKNIIRELNNEKIDIVEYIDDPVKLLQSILNPIEVKKINVDQENNIFQVIVADEDYPIVIGKRGMNARLNGQLIGVELDVRKQSEYNAEEKIRMQEVADDENPELDEPLTVDEATNQFVLDSLIEAGFDTARKLLNVTTKELAKTASISEEMADDIMQNVRNKRM